MRAPFVASFALAVMSTPATALADEPDWGFQVGGPAFVEFVFRPRLFGPMRREVGGLPIFGGGGVRNASAGLFVEILPQPNWEPYAAVGGAVGQACGEDLDRGLVCSTIYFVSARVGAAVGVGEGLENRVTVDAGAWYGRVDPADDEPSTFLIPMAGVGFYW